MAGLNIRVGFIFGWSGDVMELGWDGDLIGLDLFGDLVPLEIWLGW